MMLKGTLVKILEEENKFTIFIYIVVEMISAGFLAKYMQVEREAILRCGLFFALLFLFNYIKRKKVVKVEKVVIFVFSFIVTLSIIFGYHIHVEDSYSGLMSQNYIIEFNYVDALACIALIFAIAQITTAAYTFVRDMSIGNGNIKLQYLKLNKKKVFVAAVLIFVLWLPYLLTYWPGFIFGDSLGSINQALGYSELSNHHPVMYTLFIRACLRVGHVFTNSDNTIGLALSSITQMLYMAMCLGYMICWIVKRGNIKSFWGILMIVFYGTTPYIATHSIAMWKDPIFSVSIVILTLYFSDFLISKGKVVRDKIWMLGYAFFMLVTIFSRNNGFYIVLFMTMAMIIFWIINRKNNFGSVSRSLILISIFIMSFSKFITGPIYQYFGVIPTEKVESVGVFLNQMARVATYNGNMTEEDAAYMNEILPIDLYQSTYRPCCTDLLKWDSHFNGNILENDFFRHWFSMFKRNPKLYFESWELETYGFWTINTNAREFGTNIGGGVPRNTVAKNAGDLAQYNIQAKNLFGSDVARNIFKQDDYSIQIGTVNLLILFLCICVILNGRFKMLIPLAPSVGVTLTLLIASPISYWPRYGLALQLLIPFYLLLFLTLMRKKTQI